MSTQMIGLLLNYKHIFKKRKKYFLFMYTSSTCSKTWTYALEMRTYRTLWSHHLGALELVQRATHTNHIDNFLHPLALWQRFAYHNHVPLSSSWISLHRWLSEYIAWKNSCDNYLSLLDSQSRQAIENMRTSNSSLHSHISVAHNNSLELRFNISPCQISSLKVL